MFLNAFKRITSAGVPSLQLVRRLDIITASGGGIYLDGSALAAAELGYVDGVTAGTGIASKALVLSSTSKLSISGSSVGAFLTVAPAATGAGLKIHTHSNVNNSGGATYDYTYMNEFKGEFVSTSGTMVGVGADYTLSGSGTGAMCASSGYAKLLTGITMSGAATPTAGILTGGQFFANIAGTVNGAGCEVMGLYGGIDYNTGGVITTCDFITGICGEYRSNIDCATGTSSIMRLVKGGTASTAVDYGIHMTASNGTISNGLYITGATKLGSLTSTADGLYLTVSALTVGDAYSGFRSVVTAVAAHNEYGMSAYFDSTITGTTAGHCYGVGSWINTATTPVLSAGHIIVPFEGGVYTGEAQATARIVFGGQHQAILGGVPASLHAWRLNTNRTVTALIAAANSGSVGYTAGTGTSGTQLGYIPMFDIVGVGIGYLRIYATAT